jgi:membrane associated rhomboid family serine protease
LIRQRADGSAIRPVAWATTALLVLCLLAFAVQLVLSREQELVLIHVAAIVPRWLLGDVPRPPDVALLPVWLTPLSAVFLQPGLIQFSLNLLWLGIFGPRLERALGPARYALLLLLCIYGSTVFQALSIRDLSGIIGAGGIAGGILGASLALHPKGLLRLRLVSLSLPLPAIFLLVGWFALDLVYAVRDVAGARTLRVAYPMHLAGFLLGAGCAALLRPRGLPLFDANRGWFSLVEWDEPPAPGRRFSLAALAGLYLAVAAAAIARGRF